MKRVGRKHRILVVEDEESIRDGICDVLAYHGYAPAAAVTGEEGLERGLEEKFHLVILDLMLPGLDGLEVCAKLRRRLPDLPILMLTAKGSEDDIVAGLRCGADDYVTKPFSIRELVARVEALLRRSGELDTGEDFEFGPWEVDAQGLAATLHLVSGHPASGGEHTIRLSRREVDLLRIFARQAGRVLSRRTLLQQVWGFVNVDEIETRTVDVHVAKLRKKIDGTAALDGDPPKGRSRTVAPEARKLRQRSLIETVRGAGYRANL